jgi:hypothetical protein
MSASQLIANRFEISDPEKDLLGRGGIGSYSSKRNVDSW